MLFVEDCRNRELKQVDPRLLESHLKVRQVCSKTLMLQSAGAVPLEALLTLAEESWYPIIFPPWDTRNRNFRRLLDDPLPFS